MLGGQESAFQKRLAEELALLPGRLSRYFFLLATLDTQVNQVSDQLGASRAALLGNAGKAFHCADNSNRTNVQNHTGSDEQSEHTSEQYQKTPGEPPTLPEQDAELHASAPLTALKELHLAQRQLLEDKLFVDRSAVDWFHYARNIVLSHNAEIRQQQKTEPLAPYYRVSNTAYSSGGGTATAAYNHLRHPQSQDPFWEDTQAGGEVPQDSQSFQRNVSSSTQQARSVSTFKSHSPALPQVDAASPLRQPTTAHRLSNNMSLRNSNTGSNGLPHQLRSGVSSTQHSASFCGEQQYAEDITLSSAELYTGAGATTKKKRRISSVSQPNRSDALYSSGTFVGLNSNPTRELNNSDELPLLSTSCPTQSASKGAIVTSRSSIGDQNTSTRVRHKAQNRVASTVTKDVSQSAGRGQGTGVSPTVSSKLVGATTAPSSSANEGLIIKLGSQKGRPRKSLTAPKPSSASNDDSNDTAPAKGSKMKLKHKLAVDAFGLEGECANAEDESLCPACYKASSGAMVQCDRCDKWCHCACVGFVVDASAAEKPFYCPCCGDASTFNDESTKPMKAQNNLNSECFPELNMKHQENSGTTEFMP